MSTTLSIYLFQIVLSLWMQSPELLEVQSPDTAEAATTLDLMLFPALTRDGDPWTVRLHGGVSERTATASFGGSVRLEGLVPGTYEIWVSSGEGDREDRWTVHPIELVSGFQEASIEIDQVIVSGRLQLGGTPMPGLLRFGGADAYVSIAVQTEDDGRFEAVLPRDGDWEVDVEARGMDGFRRASPVWVQRDADGEAAEIIVELGGTKVTLWVLDPEGDPESEAGVYGISRTSKRKVYGGSVDEKGEVVVRGLPADEEVRFLAFSGDGRSASKLVTLSESGWSELVTLRIERLITATGAVSFRDLPVPGADVYYQVDGWDPGHAVTTPGGLVELVVPERSQDVVVAVLPRQGPVTLVRAAIHQGSLGHIELSRDHGHAVLDVDPGQGWRAFLDGLEIPRADAFISWATQGHGRPGGGLDRPAISIASGHLVFCPSESPGLPPAPNVIPVGCNGGYVAPHGSLEGVDR